MADPRALAQEAREKAEAATEGPWLAEQKLTEESAAEEYGVDAEDVSGGAWWINHGGWIDCDDYGLFFNEPDAEFIAWCRSAVPALADAVEGLVAERDELRGRLDSLVFCPWCMGAFDRGPEAARHEVRCGELHALAEDNRG